MISYDFERLMRSEKIIWILTRPPELKIDHMRSDDIWSDGIGWKSDSIIWDQITSDDFW